MLASTTGKACCPAIRAQGDSKVQLGHGAGGFRQKLLFTPGKEVPSWYSVFCIGQKQLTSRSILLKQGTVVSQPTGESVRDAEPDPKKHGVGKTVLVVDDNVPMRRMIAAAFLSDGFKTCAEADNGQEGIVAAKRIMPDLITLDLSMPLMNGLEAAPELRKLFPKIPIILFCLYGEEQLESEASRAGINLVLSKTEPLSTLLKTAHELMGSQAVKVVHQTACARYKSQR